jgi:hypothetical protein
VGFFGSVALKELTTKSNDPLATIGQQCHRTTPRVERSFSRVFFIKGEIMLKHLKQPNKWGCMYYSAFALTGDKRWLEYETNISPVAFLAHVGKLGYALKTIFVEPNHFSNLEKYAVGLSFWQSCCQSLEKDAYAPMLVTLGELELGLGHQVAICVTPDDVMISDSSKPEVIILIHEDFLESKYAQAVEISILMTFEEALEYQQDGQVYFAKQHLEKLENLDSDLEMVQEFA